MPAYFEIHKKQKILFKSFQYKKKIRKVTEKQLIIY